jgi:hypothetical protein
MSEEPGRYSTGWEDCINHIYDELQQRRMLSGIFLKLYEHMRDHVDTLQAWEDAGCPGAPPPLQKKP